MQIRDWRSAEGKSQGECAEALRLDGGARSFQRIETGENKADADLIERIAVLTGGVVSAVDMHQTRLAWLKANRPERFETAPIGDDLLPVADAGPAVTPPAAGPVPVSREALT